MTQSNRVSDAEVTTTVRLPVEMVEAFKGIAARNHRSFAGELRFVVETYIAESDGAEQAAA